MVKVEYAIFIICYAIPALAQVQTCSSKVFGQDLYLLNKTSGKMEGIKLPSGKTTSSDSLTSFRDLFIDAKTKEVSSWQADQLVIIGYYRMQEENGIQSKVLSLLVHDTATKVTGPAMSSTWSHSSRFYLNYTNNSQLFHMPIHTIKGDGQAPVLVPVFHLYDPLEGASIGPLEMDYSIPLDYDDSVKSESSYAPSITTFDDVTCIIGGFRDRRIKTECMYYGNHSSQRLPLQTVYDAQPVSIDQTLYLCGGETEDKDGTKKYNDECVSLNLWETYTKLSWAEHYPIPKYKEGWKAFAIGRKMYIIGFGGHDGSSLLLFDVRAQTEKNLGTHFANQKMVLLKSCLTESLKETECDNYSFESRRSEDVKYRCKYYKNNEIHYCTSASDPCGEKCKQCFCSRASKLYPGYDCSLKDEQCHRFWQKGKLWFMKDNKYESCKEDEGGICSETDSKGTQNPSNCWKKCQAKAYTSWGACIPRAENGNFKCDQVSSAEGTLALEDHFVTCKHYPDRTRDCMDKELQGDNYNNAVTQCSKNDCEGKYEINGECHRSGAGDCIKNRTFVTVIPPQYRNNECTRKITSPSPVDCTAKERQQYCDRDCAWNNWSPWADCKVQTVKESKGCYKLRERTLKTQPFPLNKECEGQTHEHMECADKHCQRPCDAFTVWEPWQPCVGAVVKDNTKDSWECTRIRKKKTGEATSQNWNSECKLDIPEGEMPLQNCIALQSTSPTIKQKVITNCSKECFGIEKLDESSCVLVGSGEALSCKGKNIFIPAAPEEFQGSCQAKIVSASQKDVTCLGDAQQRCERPCQWEDWTSWSACAVTENEPVKACARSRTRAVKAHQFPASKMCDGDPVQPEQCEDKKCTHKCFATISWEPWQSCKTEIEGTDANTWKCIRTRTFDPEGDMKVKDWNEDCEKFDAAHTWENCVNLYNNNTESQSEIQHACSEVCHGTATLNVSTCTAIKINDDWKCKGVKKFVPAAPEIFQDKAQCQPKKNDAKLEEKECIGENDKKCHRECQWAQWSEDWSNCSVTVRAQDTTGCFRTKVRKISVHPYPIDRVCSGENTKYEVCHDATCQKDTNLRGYRAEATGGSANKQSDSKCVDGQVLLADCNQVRKWSDWTSCQDGMDRDENWSCKRTRSKITRDLTSVPWNQDCPLDINKSEMPYEDCVGLHDNSDDEALQTQITNNCSQVCYGAESLNTSSCEAIEISDVLECKGRKMFVPAAAKKFQDTDKCGQINTQSSQTFADCEDKHCIRDCKWSSWNGWSSCGIVRSPDGIAEGCIRTRNRDKTLEQFPLDRKCEGTPSEDQNCTSATECVQNCNDYQTWASWNRCSSEFIEGHTNWTCMRQRDRVYHSGRSAMWKETCPQTIPGHSKGKDDCHKWFVNETAEEVKAAIIKNCSDVCHGVTSLDPLSCEPKLQDNTEIKNQWECRGRNKFIPKAPAIFINEEVCSNKYEDAKDSGSRCKGEHEAKCTRECEWSEWSIEKPCSLRDENNETTCEELHHRSVRIEAYPFTQCPGSRSRQHTCDAGNSLCKRDCQYSEFESENSKICERLNIEFKSNAEGDCVHIETRAVTKKNFGNGIACNRSFSHLNRMINCSDQDSIETCHRNCTIKLVTSFTAESDWTDIEKLTPECGLFKTRVSIKDKYSTWLVSPTGAENKRWCSNFEANGTLHEKQLPGRCPDDTEELLTQCMVMAKAKIDDRCRAKCGLTHVKLPDDFVIRELGDLAACGRYRTSWKNVTNLEILRKQFSGNMKCDHGTQCGTNCIYHLIEPTQIGADSKSNSDGDPIFTSQGFTKQAEGTQPPSRCGGARRLTRFYQITDYQAISNTTESANCLEFSDDKQLETNNNYFQTEYEPLRCLQNCVPLVWEDWSHCSVTCGIGSRSRSRKIIFNSGDEEQPCDTSEDIEPCMFKPCDNDIKNNHCLYLKYSQVVSYDEISKNQWIKVAGNSTCKPIGKPGPIFETRKSNKRAPWQWRDPKRITEVEKKSQDIFKNKDQSPGTMIYVIIVCSSLVGLMVVGVIAFYVGRRKMNKQIILTGVKDKGKKANRPPSTSKKSLPTSMSKAQSKVSLDSESMEKDDRPKIRFQRGREKAKKKFKSTYKIIKQQSKSGLQKTLKSIIEPSLLSRKTGATKSVIDAKSINASNRSKGSKMESKKRPDSTSSYKPNQHSTSSAKVATKTANSSYKANQHSVSSAKVDTKKENE